MKTNIPFIFRFLEDLSAHNDREWFNAHRPQYEAARTEFDNFLSTVIARISLFDEEIRHVQPKDCTYRIYRDTRFSADKTPYKNHFGGYINARGKKSFHCGYYVHLQPGGSMLAGGSLCLPSDMLRAIRQSIVDNIDEYRGIVEDPAFRHYFPVVGEDFLKTAPKGFPKDFPYVDYLKPKEFICSYGVPDNFFVQPDVLERIETAFRQFKRFADFLNYTIDDFE
ncbi:MAG: DUF2461 domain-containing protein [Mediterranea sp.]|jgi:uncharacterized protein (TIGR02453 family)|nr:DUF2461 domain-containing protein [Mediterranea sp.]